MRRPSIEIEQRDRLRPATRPEDMGLAAGNEDEIALGHLNHWSILERDAGIYLPPGTRTELSGDLTIVECGRPARTRRASRPAPDDDRAGRPISAGETPAHQTGDRWYRELIQAEVTQFIGGIPPGRAPDHFHLYEEVICILDGVGVMHAGATSTPIAAGSCIFLPRKQRHCVENTGDGELRLLGVFYPAGSPAARYPT